MSFVAKSVGRSKKYLRQKNKHLYAYNYETDTQCLQSSLVAPLPVAPLLRGYYNIHTVNRNLHLPFTSDGGLNNRHPTDVPLVLLYVHSHHRETIPAKGSRFLK